MKKNNFIYKILNGENTEILFDYKWFFRIQDILRVFIKKWLLGRLLYLRNKQSCRYCGRDQHIVWKCEDVNWIKLPKKWYNTTLCLECFIALYPDKLNSNDIEILAYDCGYKM